jgi:hypothetical protein
MTESINVIVGDYKIRPYFCKETVQSIADDIKGDIYTVNPETTNSQSYLEDNIAYLVISKEKNSINAIDTLGGFSVTNEFITSLLKKL